MIQLLLNALASAAIIAPAAVAFTLIFTLFRYANFAAGAFVVFGSYAAWVVNVGLGLPLWTGGVVAMLVTALLVALCDRLVFRPLRGRDGATLLLVSVALSFVVENVLRFLFGTSIRGYDLPLVGPMVFGGVRVTWEMIGIISASAASIALVGLLLAFTRAGQALRAVSDNPSLAAVRGLPVRRVQLLGLVISGALFGLSGTLVGVDLAIEPSLAWVITIPVIAAAIFGGLGSPAGAAIGALVIGIAEELTVLFISPPYKAAVGFVVIAVMLLLRPQGLLGVEIERK